MHYFLSLFDKISNTYGISTLSILDAWLVDDEVQVAVEVLQDEVNNENETEEERGADDGGGDDGEVPSKNVHKQPKRNIFLGLLAFCAVIGISVAVAVPLSRRSSLDEEESDTADQAVPWEVSTTSSTTDDDKNVHKAPVPSFISDALSVKYTQFSQGILRAPGLASFYGDCRTAAMSVDGGVVQTVKYNEINDMWDVMNKLREDGFGDEIDLAKINQVLAVSRPRSSGVAGSIRVYSLTELNSDQKWSSLGDDIDGTNPSLSVEGDVLASVVQGADGDDRVRVYRFDTITENWVQLGSDIIVGESRKTYARISQFGDYLVLGATLDELGLGSLTAVFKLNDEEEWSHVGNTLYDESSVYHPLINVHGDTIATSGVDIEGLPRASVYRLVEDEWTQEASFDERVITAMSADGKRLGMCSSQRQVCSVHNYYDISKEYGEVATYTDFVPLHFERGGFSNLESGVCGIASSNSKTTIGYTTVPW